MELGICTGEIIANVEEETFQISEIAYKIMCLPHESKYELIPLLHNCSDM